jgi:NTP pyrophosphatase (non-canonical NTP hydrolase)
MTNDASSPPHLSKLQGKLPPPRVGGLKEAQLSFQAYQSIAFFDRPPSFFALELAGECGELCNVEKKIWRDPERPIDHLHLAEEAADVLITLLNYCNARGIDLEGAVETKLVQIEERRVQGLMGATRPLSSP